MTPQRAIPAVGKLLDALGPTDLPRPLLTQLVRQQIAALRLQPPIPSFDEILRALQSRIATLARSRLQPIINGTGILLHTNFGRAPLGATVVQELQKIAGNYSNLEFDLATGTRGKRGGYLEQNLALLCGSEAATVVNNCAAALVLIVRHFTAKKPEVIVSRGELVQIGGGFRIGEIIAASGARVREVGATNKTTIDDYAAAISAETGLILRVHQSNFYMSGFADAPPNEKIARLARSRRIPFVVDLGSGALVATEQFGIREHEPTPQENLRGGADLVCFSGDKLLGGPQAGIIAGKARRIQALKREPLFRTLRCDKLVFAALQATVEAHLRNDHEEIPIIALLKTPLPQLHQRAELLVRQLEDTGLQGFIVESKGEIGGGALPRSIIPSVALEITAPGFSPNELAARLRSASPAVVGYVARGAFRLDLRTIFAAQDEQLIGALRSCLTNT